MTKVLADAGNKGTRDIEKAVCMEGLREHADVLEVNDADTLRRNVRDVAEEVVGMIYGEIIRQRDGSWPFPQAARKPLLDRDSSITSHKSSQG